MASPSQEMQSDTQIKPSTTNADGNINIDASASQTSTTSNQSSTATINDNLHEYTPQMMTNYIQFYKQGNDDSTSTTTTNNEPIKKKKRKSKKHIPPQVIELRRQIQFCCKDNDLHRALILFRSAIQDGEGESSMIRLEPQTFYNLLNLCEGSFGSGEGRVHVGTPKVMSRNDTKSVNDNGKEERLKSTVTSSNDDLQTETNNNNNNNNLTLDQRLHHARQIHTLLTQLNIPCIEPAFTALIRLAVRVGNYELAERYLVEAEGTQQCKVKLRMYSSLLRGYCGDLTGELVHGMNSGSNGGSRGVPSREGLVKALKVWKRMYENSGGISSGHPRYHETKSSLNQGDGSSTSSAQQQQQQQQQQQLFGEGVSPKISLSEYEYSALLKCATALKDVKVAERVLNDIAESVMVPGLSTMESILDWFRSDCCKGTLSGDNTSDGTTLANGPSAMDDVTLPPREGEGLTVGPITNDSGRGWKIYRNCTIDSSTGLLQLRSSKDEQKDETTSSDNATSSQIEYRLKPVELTQKAWRTMREMNSSIVVEGTVKGNISQYQGGGKGKKRPRGSDVVSKLHDGNAKQASSQHNNNNNGRSKKDPDWRMKHWKEFESFIENHPPYNVVIDGANVGYYNQTYRLGSNAPRHVDYKQIDGLIRHVLELPSEDRHHIILFMHERHFSQKLLPHWAYPIVQRWDGNEAPYDRLTVYRTPQGLNDDWYWMHAALINGGRDDKPLVLAVTNDEMRDHHFQMTAQGCFLRWKERHQVHFDFGEWNRGLRRNDVLLEYPSIYSRRIQRVVGETSSGAAVDGADSIVIPLPKKGDENRFVDGVHVADDGIPEEETYVVVQRVTS